MGHPVGVVPSDQNEPDRMDITMKVLSALNTVLSGVLLAAIF